jgi:hypothetical protein
MTVDKRSEEAAVDESWNGHIVRPGCEVSDHFAPVVIAFELVPVGIPAAATETVREVVWIKILDSGQTWSTHDLDYEGLSATEAKSARS